MQVGDRLRKTRFADVVTADDKLLRRVQVEAFKERKGRDECRCIDEPTPEGSQPEGCSPSDPAKSTD